MDTLPVIDEDDERVESIVALLLRRAAASRAATASALLTVDPSVAAGHSGQKDLLTKGE
jgi:hypothetical protein